MVRCEKFLAILGLGSLVHNCQLWSIKTNASSMHEAGHPKPVLWDNPEGSSREGGGMGVQDGGDTCIPVADSC